MAGKIEVDADYFKWLEFFYRDADFGPAHDDVMMSIQEEFTKETGITLDWWNERMKTVVTAPERVLAPGPSVFLAGGISDVGNWQSQAIDLLKTCLIYNPRRENFPMGDEDEGKRQIEWEFEHLEAADVILFWFSWETLQPIALYELGRWIAQDKIVIVGCHPEFKRRFDVIEQVRLAKPEVNIHDNLEDVCAEANRYLDIWR